MIVLCYSYNIMMYTIHAGSSVSTSKVIVAAIIPSLLALTFMLALISIIVKRVTNKTDKNNVEEVYYSTVGPPKIEKSTTNKVDENVAYGVHIPKYY